MIADKKTHPADPGIYKTHKTRLYRSHNLLIFLILTGIAIVFIITSPASAREQYMTGSHEFFPAIAGIDEWSPAHEVLLPAGETRNTGINQSGFVKPGIVDRDDRSDTVKFPAIMPGLGNTGIVIKSDPTQERALIVSGATPPGLTVRGTS
jgi:hypothetical protein